MSSKVWTRPFPRCASLNAQNFSLHHNTHTEKWAVLREYQQMPRVSIVNTSATPHGPKRHNANTSGKRVYSLLQVMDSNSQCWKFYFDSLKHDNTTVVHLGNISFSAVWRRASRFHWHDGFRWILFLVCGKILHVGQRVLKSCSVVSRRSHGRMSLLQTFSTLLVFVQFLFQAEKREAPFEIVSKVVDKDRKDGNELFARGNRWGAMKKYKRVTLGLSLASIYKDSDFPVRWLPRCCDRSFLHQVPSSWAATREIRSEMFLVFPSSVLKPRRKTPPSTKSVPRIWCRSADYPGDTSQHRPHPPPRSRLRGVCVCVCVCVHPSTPVHASSQLLNSWRKALHVSGGAAAAGVSAGRRRGGDGAQQTHDPNVAQPRSLLPQGEHVAQAGNVKMLANTLVLLLLRHHCYTSWMQIGHQPWWASDFLASAYKSQKVLNRTSHRFGLDLKSPSTCWHCWVFFFSNFCRKTSRRNVSEPRTKWSTWTGTMQRPFTWEERYHLSPFTQFVSKWNYLPSLRLTNVFAGVDRARRVWQGKAGPLESERIETPGPRYLQSFSVSRNVSLPHCQLFLLLFKGFWQWNLHFHRLVCIGGACGLCRGDIKHNILCYFFCWQEIRKVEHARAKTGSSNDGNDSR